MEPLGILVAGFCEFLRGCGLSHLTIKRNGYLLGKFSRWMAGRDIREVNRETIVSYREHIAATPGRLSGKPLSKQTIALEMKTLKGFFDFLLKQGRILTNPLEGMKLTVKGGARLRKIFTEEDIALFLDSIPVSSSYSQRDRALFELVYSSGLRAGDVIHLEMEHVNLEERVLSVRGKGNKDAYIPFSRTAQRFLVNYLNDGRMKLLKRMNKSSLEEAKPQVFVGKKGKLNYGRLLARFHSYLESCGLSGKGYTIHSIRHATGTHLLKHGASVRYVQELLRHEDLKTTQTYTRPGNENIKRVYRSFHPRENEYYKEIDCEYLAEVEKLKQRLLWGREVSRQYKKEGHTRGCGSPGSRTKDFDRER